MFTILCQHLRRKILLTLEIREPGDGLVVGEGKDELAALSGLAFYPDTAAMGLDNSATNAETEPCAGFLCSLRTIRPKEFIKDSLLVIHGNPRPGIRHTDLSKTGNKDMFLNFDRWNFIG